MGDHWKQRGLPAECQAEKGLEAGSRRDKQDDLQAPEETRGQQGHAGALNPGPRPDVSAGGTSDAAGNPDDLEDQRPTVKLKRAPTVGLRLVGNHSLPSLLAAAEMVPSWDSVTGK